MHLTVREVAFCFYFETAVALLMFHTGRHSNKMQGETHAFAIIERYSMQKSYEFDVQIYVLGINITSLTFRTL